MKDSEVTPRVLRLIREYGDPETHWAKLRDLVKKRKISLAQAEHSHAGYMAIYRKAKDFDSAHGQSRKLRSDAKRERKNGKRKAEKRRMELGLTG